MRARGWRWPPHLAAGALAPAKKRAPKYGNTVCEVDGMRFDSQAEGALYGNLQLQKKAGLVSHFLRQVPFHLPGGITYRLDFLVFYPGGRVRYLDCKGFETATFKLKVKQVEALYPVEIECIRFRRGRFLGL